MHIIKNRDEYNYFPSEHNSVMENNCSGRASQDRLSGK